MRLMLEIMAAGEEGDGEEMSDDRLATRGDLIWYTIFVFVLGLLSAKLVMIGFRWITVTALIVNIPIALGGFFAINDTLPKR